MRTRHSSLALALSLCFMITSAAGLASAAPEHQPAWRIDKVLRHCGNDSMSSVIALNAHNAWAIGAPNWAGPPCAVDFEHWNGSSWHQIRTPRKITLPFFTFNQPLAASSPKNVWILIVDSAVTVSPTQTWAFGRYYIKKYTLAPYTARFDGRSWHRVSTPGVPYATTGLAGRVWVVGPTLKTSGLPVDKQVLVPRPGSTITTAPGPPGQSSPPRVTTASSSA
ncbi:MAG TPA: hypothetical protein VFI65_11285 [Streptosporangiaceae bacterium]|nr:hypothetical protein [Streptosporangiaceae bacterium]